MLISQPTQYVSSQFSAGYHATIGADFIAKTVPHYSDSDESVTLQIWVSPPIPSLRLHAIIAHLSQ
jgi:GTPase SAR1 family protein